MRGSKGPSLEISGRFSRRLFWNSIGESTITFESSWSCHKIARHFHSNSWFFSAPLSPSECSFSLAETQYRLLQGKGRDEEVVEEEGVTIHSVIVDFSPTFECTSLINILSHCTCNMCYTCITISFYTSHRCWRLMTGGGGGRGHVHHTFQGLKCTFMVYKLNLSPKIVWIALLWNENASTPVTLVVVLIVTRNGSFVSFRAPFLFILQLNKSTGYFLSGRTLKQEWKRCQKNAQPTHAFCQITILTKT